MGNRFDQHTKVALGERAELLYFQDNHSNPTGLPNVPPNEVFVIDREGHIKPAAQLAADLQQMLFLETIAEGAKASGATAAQQISGFSPAVQKYGVGKPYEEQANSMHALGEKFARQSEMLFKAVKREALAIAEGRESERTPFAASHGVEGDPAAPSAILASLAKAGVRQI